MIELDVGFVMYEGMTALDLVGVAEVLAHLPEVRVHYVAAGTAPVRADNGMLFTPSITFARLERVDVVVVPGSGTPSKELQDVAVIDWLRSVHPLATWTTSVCTGASLLAEAGALDGCTATTHWAFRHLLTDRGIQVSTDRVVRDGSILTAAGVSAGIDMALTLAGILFVTTSHGSPSWPSSTVPNRPTTAGRPPPRRPRSLRAPGCF